MFSLWLRQWHRFVHIAQCSILLLFFLWLFTIVFFFIILVFLLPFAIVFFLWFGQWQRFVHFAAETAPEFVVLVKFGDFSAYVLSPLNNARSLKTVKLKCYGRSLTKECFPLDSGGRLPFPTASSPPPPPRPRPPPPAFPPAVLPMVVQCQHQLINPPAADVLTSETYFSFFLHAGGSSVVWSVV